MILVNSGISNKKSHAVFGQIVYACISKVILGKFDLFCHSNQSCKFALKPFVPLCSVTITSHDSYATLKVFHISLGVQLLPTLKTKNCEILLQNMCDRPAKSVENIKICDGCDPAHEHLGFHS
jgi:hypothetical protein